LKWGRPSSPTFGPGGIKLAEPDRDVICMLGDGGYMMANSDLTTAGMMDVKITLVITDNRGLGCINRLQMGTGGTEFDNLLDMVLQENPSDIDFAAPAMPPGLLWW
jgi:3D-(3,5/4)-trihydroxycyclohexane-1,2-dione acylhydrolase (decyclizing)